MGPALPGTRLGAAGRIPGLLPLLGLLLVAGTGAGALAQDGGCPSDGVLNYVCGPERAEDIERLGDTGWLVATGMQPQRGPVGDISGKLYLVDLAARTAEPWFPGPAPRFDFDFRTYATCPGPLDVDNFSAHGISIGEPDGNLYRLYITSHGGREAVEAFEVDVSGAQPAIEWIGCVPLPAYTSSNAVAMLSDGGFIVTKMLDSRDPNPLESIFRARRAGGVLFEWHPGGEVEAIPGTDMIGPNGIELSDDERYIYVVEANQWPALGRRLTIPTSNGVRNDV